MKKPTIYVITHHAFNHEGKKRREIDARFLESDKNYVYFLIDKECPQVLKNKNVIYEKDFGPVIQEAGKKHFAEWSFLLAEAEQSFCTYPLFFVSSRFYEKNRWLMRDLNQEWDRLFSYLDQYGWGVLPSYDRPFSWLDLWVDSSLPQYQNNQFTFCTKLYDLYREIYGVDIPKEYRYSPDFGCNYIGFKDREALMAYVNFHKKTIGHFFDNQYKPKVNIDDYIFSKNLYREEKTFTFIIENQSKLFFYNNMKKYFGLHYDGYYELDERNTQHRVIEPFHVGVAAKVFRVMEKQRARLRNYKGKILTALRG